MTSNRKPSSDKPMRQLQQNLKSGATEIVDVPVPNCGASEILIQSTVSLISPGTERMLVDFGKASLVQKAMQQPHRVKDVLVKARNDGLVATAKAVNSKLGQPLPLERRRLHPVHLRLRCCGRLRPTPCSYGFDPK